MNRSIINSLIVASLSMAFIACEAAGPKRIDTATASMSDTKDMLTRGSTEVTGALAAAEAIGATPDLKASYESFSKSLSTLEKTADQVRDRWASLTATRRDSFTARITAIRTSMGEVKTSYEAFVADMSDIHVLLANDLTADGIKSVKPLLAKAKKDADTVQTKATAATKLLEDAIAGAATTLPTPPAAPAAAK